MAPTAAGLRDDCRVTEREYDDLLRLTGLVRVALGRLGGRVSPWLDEGLLIGQGLTALIGVAAGPEQTPLCDDAAVAAVVGAMRRWARASSWYHAALPCRVAPLCAARAAGCRTAARDDQIARELGIAEDALPERYTEAGLLFGVSPELLLPERGSPAGAAGLAGALAGLPVEQRRLLTLYFEDGLSFPEIASLLGVSAERAQESYGRAATLIRGRMIDANLEVHR